MNKKTFLLLLFLSVLSLLIGLIAVYPDQVGICGFNDLHCIFPVAFIAFNFGEPLTFWMLLFIPTLIFAYLFKISVWKKIAMIYIPISVILIYLAPVTCGGFFNLLCLDKEIMSWLTAGGLASITLILILIKGIKMLFKKKPSK